MKILWLTNFPLPQIAKKLGMSGGVNEGWLTGLAGVLSKVENIKLQIPAASLKVFNSPFISYI